MRDPEGQPVRAEYTEVRGRFWVTVRAVTRTKGRCWNALIASAPSSQHPVSLPVSALGTTLLSQGNARDPEAPGERRPLLSCLFSFRIIPLSSVRGWPRRSHSCRPAFRPASSSPSVLPCPSPPSVSRDIPRLGVGPTLEISRYFISWAFRSSNAIMSLRFREITSPNYTEAR